MFFKNRGEILILKKMLNFLSFLVLLYISGHFKQKFFFIFFLTDRKILTRHQFMLFIFLCLCDTVVSPTTFPQFNCPTIYSSPPLKTHPHNLASLTSFNYFRAIRSQIVRFHGSNHSTINGK